ncbi:H-2 class I histocompatibility antigen, alpha chain-like [Astyanax mexicanus]|uniref:H-2 class I histocompatibility antigen, alpha chain-like n=1 Tax=Astyanax mexicanus TaxID=7994 RepID=UPI0020CB2FEA|nr:H-2 class I histocompatibility antigen, alpha chain-like [Astyanax mexicanus]
MGDGEKDVHSLYYIYTIQNGTNHSAVILLDDRHIDCSEKSQTLKPEWLKNIPDSTWKNSTDMLKEDGQRIENFFNIMMNEFSNPADGHVLQWRHGCEGEQSSDGSLTVLNSINEFGYDGEDLIQFNFSSKTWITPEEKKNREREEEWNFVQNTVRKCEQCVEILKTYLQYRTTESNQATPAVHIFAKKSVRDSRKLILTCMATGFYPKHVKMSLRKFGTSIPDHLITSSGVRPNNDGTYQLRKSVEIQEDDKAQYDCYVSHSSLTEPVIKKWVNTNNGAGLVLIGGAVGGLIVILLIVLGVVFFVLRRKRMLDGAGPPPVFIAVPQNPNAQPAGTVELGEKTALAFPAETVN